MKILQILLLIFSATILINAQEPEKSFVLTGTVYDSGGSVLPTAKVVATNSKGEVFEGIADDKGIYSVKLPFNKNPSVKSKIEKFKIVVSVQGLGFEEFSMSDFKFVPAYTGKMYFDIALDYINLEPCGVSGAECLQDLTPVEKTKSKISKKIRDKPLIKKGNN